MSDVFFDVLSIFDVFFRTHLIPPESKKLIFNKNRLTAKFLFMFMYFILLKTEYKK